MDEATATASGGSETKTTAAGTKGSEPQAHGPSTGRDWRRDAEVFTQRARVFVADNPLAALGIALAAGFVVGRIVRKVS